MRAGHPPAIVHYFRRWQSGPVFDPAAASLVQGGGAVPMISWQPEGGLEPVARGTWDAHVTAVASAMATYAGPLLLRFAHEMNLPRIPWHGPAATFLAAWHRVRAAFAGAGATNVRWVWSPYVNGRGVADLRSYFPGTERVDWVALDGYNWGRHRPWHRWPSFEALFGPSLRELNDLAPTAPIMLAEIGCSPRGGDKAAWMREALLHAIPERYQQIRAVVWFDHYPPEHEDWRIDSSPATLRVWQAVAADPRYALTATELARLPAT